MSWSAGKSEKCCLTCENWGGCRNVNYAKRAETDSPSTRGKCFAGMPADASQGPSAMAGRQCSKHRTWSRL